MPRISQVKLDAQGGARKKRGFWKDPETLSVLKQVESGGLTTAEAAELLGTTEIAVKWYVRGKRPSRKAAPIEHGAEAIA